MLDAVGGPMFEPSLKSLRYGGRQVAITSVGNGRVEFSLVDFYHNRLSLRGVDFMKLTGPRLRGSWMTCEWVLRTAIGDLRPFRLGRWIMASTRIRRLRREQRRAKRLSPSDRLRLRWPARSGRRTYTGRAFQLPSVGLQAVQCALPERPSVDLTSRYSASNARHHQSAH